MDNLASVSWKFQYYRTDFNAASYLLIGANSVYLSLPSSSSVLRFVKNVAEGCRNCFHTAHLCHKFNSCWIFLLQSSSPSYQTQYVSPICCRPFGDYIGTDKFPFDDPVDRFLIPTDFASVGQIASFPDLIPSTHLTLSNFRWLFISKKRYEGTMADQIKINANNNN